MIHLALRMGRVMSPASWWSALLTQMGFLLLNLWPPGRDSLDANEVQAKSALFDWIYGPRRTIRTSNLVGRLLLQPKVVTAGGGIKLLDNTIGPRFALLSADGKARRGLCAAEPISVAQIGRLAYRRATAPYATSLWRWKVG